MYRAFDKKTGSGAIAKSKTGANVNVVLAQKTYIIQRFKNSKEEQCI